MSMATICSNTLLMCDDRGVCLAVIQHLGLFTHICIIINNAASCWWDVKALAKSPHSMRICPGVVGGDLKLVLDGAAAAVHGVEFVHLCCIQILVELGVAQFDGGGLVNQAIVEAIAQFVRLGVVALNHKIFITLIAAILDRALTLSTQWSHMGLRAEEGIGLSVAQADGLPAAEDITMGALIIWVLWEVLSGELEEVIGGSLLW